MAPAPETIWLQIMSFVQLGLGVSYFAHRTLLGLASLLEYAPQSAFASATESRPAVPVVRPRWQSLLFRRSAPLSRAVCSISVGLRDLNRGVFVRQG